MDKCAKCAIGLILFLAIHAGMLISSAGAGYWTMDSYDLPEDVVAYMSESIDVPGDGYPELAVAYYSDSAQACGIDLVRWDEVTGRYDLLFAIPPEELPDESIVTGLKAADIIPSVPGDELVIAVLGMDDHEGAVEVFGWANDSLKVLWAVGDLIQNGEWGGVLLGLDVADTDGDGLNEIYVARSLPDSSNFDLMESRLDDGVDDPFVDPLFSCQLLTVDSLGAAVLAEDTGIIYRVAAGDVSGDSLPELVYLILDLDFAGMNSYFNQLADFSDQFRWGDEGTVVPLPGSSSQDRDGRAFRSALGGSLRGLRGVFSESKVSLILRAGAGGLVRKALRAAAGRLAWSGGRPRVLRPVQVDFEETKQRILEPLSMEMPALLTPGVLTTTFVYDGSSREVASHGGFDTGMVLADLNGDGKDEIVLRNTSVDTVVVNEIIEKLDFVKATSIKTSLRIDQFTGEPMYSDTSDYPEPQRIPTSLSGLPIRGSLSAVDTSGTELWSLPMPPLSFALLAGDVDGDGDKEIVDCGWGLDQGAVNSLLRYADSLWVSYLNFLPDSTDWFWVRPPKVPTNLLKGELAVVQADQSVTGVSFPSVLTGGALTDTGLAVATVEIETGVVNDYLMELGDSLQSTGNAWRSWAARELPGYRADYDTALARENAWALDYYAWYSGGMIGDPPSHPIVDWPDWPAGEPELVEPDFTVRVAKGSLHMLARGLPPQEIYGAELTSDLATFLFDLRLTRLDADGIDDLTALREVIFRGAGDEVSVSGAVQVLSSSELALDPLLLSAVSENGGVRLVWEVQVPEDYASFRVLRAERAEGEYVVLEGSPTFRDRMFSFFDPGVKAGGRYYYRIEGTRRDGRIVFFGPTREVSVDGGRFELKLSQNFPNPFSPVTTIRFAVGRASEVSVRVFDVSGREVKTLYRDKRAKPGVYQIAWDGTNNSGEKVSSGIYFCRLKTDGEPAKVRKMILLR